MNNLINNKVFEDKTILITGGTGSFGQFFSKQLLENYNPKKIIIFSRDEMKQFEMQNKVPFINNLEKLRFFIGDIRDKDRLKFTIQQDIDIIVHAAALKQVPTAELNPFEAVKTNIIGSQNLIECSLESNVSKVIALSTDKAAAPINLYGATKLTSDKLFIAANLYKGWRDIKFSVVRYGNVMGSRGSVIPYFLKKQKEKFIPITHPNMTRFNITLEEGINFVISSLDKMWGGEIFVPKIPSYNIKDLAKVIAPKLSIKIVGLRSGEKIHEELITSSDGINTVEFDDYFVIVPFMKKWDTEEFKNKSSNNIGLSCDINFNYSSLTNPNFLSEKELKKLIIDNISNAKEILL